MCIQGRVCVLFSLPETYHCPHLRPRPPILPLSTYTYPHTHPPQATEAQKSTAATSKDAKVCMRACARVYMAYMHMCLCLVLFARTLPLSPHPQPHTHTHIHTRKYTPTSTPSPTPKATEAQKAAAADASDKIKVCVCMGGRGGN